MSARAEGLAEQGRISILGGWQYAPNGNFLRQYDWQGASPGRQSPGGPSMVASFGYAPQDWGEIGIDLYGGGQPLWRSGPAAPLVASYGALLSCRVMHLNRANYRR